MREALLGRWSVAVGEARGSIAAANQTEHAYFDVDLDVLWKTAYVAVPALLKQLETLEGQSG